MDSATWSNSDSNIRVQLLIFESWERCIFMFWFSCCSSSWQFFIRRIQNKSISRWNILLIFHSQQVATWNDSINLSDDLNTKQLKLVYSLKRVRAIQACNFFPSFNSERKLRIPFAKRAINGEKTIAGSNNAASMWHNFRFDVPLNLQTISSDFHT